MKTKSDFMAAATSTNAKLMATVAVMYAAYLPYRHLLLGADWSDDLHALGMVGAIFLGLRLPIVRDIIAAPAKLFVRMSMVRGVIETPQYLLDEVDELRVKTGLKNPVKVIVYTRGSKGNAMALNNNLYVSEQLLETLNKDERAYVLAHELTHVKNKDSSNAYITTVPYIVSYTGGLFVAVETIAKLMLKTTSPVKAGACIAFAVAYHVGQKLLSRYASREMERRADRGAIDTTKNFNAALVASIKLAPQEFAEDVSEWKRMNSTHPRGLERMQAMERHHRGDENTPMTDNFLNGNVRITYRYT